MKVTLTILLLVPMILHAQLPELSSGSLHRFENISSEYVTDRNIDVWLPEGYSENQKYPVLYMHDGQMLFDSTQTWNKQEWRVDETVSKLISEGRIVNCIVVGIWNDAQHRWSDYNPQKALKYLPDNVLDTAFAGKMFYPVNSDNYLKFLVEEVKPLIDSNFPTLPDQPNTFVMGSSMGGLISMYAICEYPEVFGGAACLSTHWVGNENNFYEEVPEAYIRYLQTNLPNPANHKIYFDFGTETLDQHYEPWQQEVDKVMKEKGYTRKNWITKKFEGAAHDERSWAKRLDVPLIFLLEK